VSPGFIAWVLLGLGPVSQVIPIIVVAAERFLYLPMLGWALLMGLLLERGLVRARRAGWTRSLPSRCYSWRTLFAP
jgi:hypothetical protein